MVNDNNRRTRTCRVIKKCCYKLIMNVYNRCKREKNNEAQIISKTRAFDKAVSYLGISERSLSNIVKTNEEDLLEPNETLKLQRGSYMLEEQIALIRPTMTDMVRNKVRIHLNNLLVNLKSSYPDLRWSRSTLYDTLTTKMGFGFKDRRNA